MTGSSFHPPLQLVQTSRPHLQLLMVLDEEVVAGQVALSSQSTHAPAAGCCDGLPPLRVEQVARDKHAIQAGAYLPVMHLQGTTALSCFCLMKALEARLLEPERAQEIFDHAQGTADICTTQCVSGCSRTSDIVPSHIRARPSRSDPEGRRCLAGDRCLPQSQIGW